VVKWSLRYNCCCFCCCSCNPRSWRFRYNQTNSDISLLIRHDAKNLGLHNEVGHVKKRGVCRVVFFSELVVLLRVGLVWQSDVMVLVTYDEKVVTCYILSSVSLPPFSCQPCLEYLCLCTLIILRLWHYISRVLTYITLHCVAKSS